ncbi:hypothetical protein [Streptomyces sp. WZ-12]|uniref:hypothetical protein n=1 Tax=Streptomyces sp. WZ-12 TaxID=3030210 RepID=UPI0023817487|nr:hypothetical protein [Streptomyces sp. WZ-12]
MSKDDLEHGITGFPECDTKAHQEALKVRENQQRDKRVLVACLILFGLWGAAMMLLSHAN